MWWFLDPLLQMLVYVIFVGIILQRRTPDYPLFVLCAILPWKWFDSTVKDGVGSVVTPGTADQADLLPEAGAAGLDHDRRAW